MPARLLFKMYSQILTTLHARQVALCHKVLNSITSRPGHRFSTLLPLKRNFSYNQGPTPRRISNRLKNSFIPSMFFFSQEVALLFVVPPLDNDQGSTEPYLACAVTLIGVAVGLLALAKVATTDFDGRECPTCRGRLWHLPVLPHSPQKISLLLLINNMAIIIIISIIILIITTIIIIIILVIVIAIFTIIILLFVVVIVLTLAININ